MKKAYLIIPLLLLFTSGCSLFSQQPTNRTNVNSADEVTTTVPAIDPIVNEDFNFTGTQEMEICNTRAICHRGAVVFADGDVLTISDNDGQELEIADSSCDELSCYVEDANGKAWDLVPVVKP